MVDAILACPGTSDVACRERGGPSEVEQCPELRLFFGVVVCCLCFFRVDLVEHIHYEIL